MLFQSLTQEVSQLEANLCSAFADPTRILILYALNEQPQNVTELVNQLGANQSTVSRHLKVLRDHGLVQTTRQGVSITYTLADHRLINALDILRAVLHDNLTSKANLMVDEII
ncbi:MAG: metalloregulator ArsR/SmtB family transcription factor [Anaerolineales bacterium]|nr:metalloregulator ArsR/SmtB family transcription factor [Anaerolineales bacterium]